MSEEQKYPDPLILHDCEELQLLHFATDSDISLVTFDIMHAKANGRTAFALRLARRLGLDYYALVPKRPHWYPTQLTDHVSKIIGASKDRPSVGYGASMGAYGVLKHARTLMTDATLAFSPQVTIDPQVTEAADKRYTQYFDPALNAGMRIEEADVGPNAYAVCDPMFAQDWFQMGMIPNGVTRIELPNLGHRSAVAMIPSSNAYANILDALLGQSDLLRRRLVAASEQTLQYAIGATRQALDENRPDDAVRIIDVAIAVHGEDRDAVILRARSYGANGDPAYGINDLREILEKLPKLITTRRDFVDLLEANGDVQGAIKELHILVGMSSNAFFAVRLFKLLKKHDPARAQRFAREAVDRWPERAEQFGL